MAHNEQTRVAFVCVQNAGRSQMATAFARRERDERDVGDEIDILTGGTDPADHVHDEVVDVMSEKGFELAGETPRAISQDEIMDVDIVITMGCSAEGICPMTWRGDARDWDLDDPDGQELDAVREIRDDIEGRVSALFDELVGEA
ncbi:MULTISPECIES: low molecular weight phosphatase family protein [Haloferax]|uniref:Low molecular weight phosphatase family protein n=2 Tax=Haloferax TaxID=2251 RepID=A0A6G1YZZ5_9EURY|nr:MULTISPECIES: low molecular weight phosphatase family protein [Haloferax]KAB1186984.1 low molecular weight phosphatase family protein [Haloferax sp. CBA1149]MRW79614.1 low molecular weight phosphatase family protein [Haloferax marinisediminis]